MPSARMTKTVCMASISPKPDQIDTIHIQRWVRVGLMSIINIVFQCPWGRSYDAVNRRNSAATGLALTAAGEGYCPHAHDSQDYSVTRHASICHDAPDAGGNGSPIYQRWSDGTTGALSRMGIPDLRLRC